MMETRFAYQTLTDRQKSDVIDLWRNAGVLPFEEAQKRVAQVSVLILKGQRIVGVSTVYEGKLGENDLPWFFFRMFIRKESRGSNRVCTQVMRTNFRELKKCFEGKFQGIVLELENTKLAKLAEKTDYMTQRGCSYYGKSVRGLGIWYVRFDSPAGIFGE
jgi:hypothetical protein